MSDWQGKHNPEDHHVGFNRAWSLTCSQWCYPDDWCEDCKRAEYGDPWEIIEAVLEVHCKPNDEKWCWTCESQEWPCQTYRLLTGGAE